MSLLGGEGSLRFRRNAQNDGGIWSCILSSKRGTVAYGGHNKGVRAVKLVLSMLFFGAVSLVNLVRRALGKTAAPEGVILYYHAIPTAQRPRFARQMDRLLRSTKPVRIDLKSPLEQGVRYSAVTFDDAFQSVVNNAVPELEKRGIPATLFITAEALGQYPQWWPERGYDERHERIVSAEQLQQLRTDLISVGSHTLTHPMLPNLSEAEARHELCVSRANLEKLLNRKITLFSFPFGAFNSSLIEWCREAGYERVFTTLPSIAFRSPGEFVTGRVTTDPRDWPLEFYLKTLGAYRWLPHAFRLKRRVLSNPLVSKVRSFWTSRAIPDNGKDRGGSLQCTRARPN